MNMPRLFPLKSRQFASDLDSLQLSWRFSASNSAGAQQVYDAFVSFVSDRLKEAGICLPMSGEDIVPWVVMKPGAISATQNLYGTVLSWFIAPEQPSWWTVSNMKKPFSRGQGLFGSEPVIMLGTLILHHGACPDSFLSAPRHGLATIGGHICHAVHFGHKYRYAASSEDEAPPEHFESCKQYEKNRKGKEVANRSPSPSHNLPPQTFMLPDLPIRLDFSDDEDDDLLQAIEASRIAYAVILLFAICLKVLCLYHPSLRRTRAMPLTQLVRGAPQWPK